MEETKTGKIYNYKTRVIIRSLLAVLTIAAVVFGSLAAYILVMVGTSEIFGKGSLESSQQYQNLVDLGVQIVHGSLEARRPFETSGELDVNKTIDIMAPQERDAKRQNKNTTFTVEDIMMMNQQLVFDGIDSISANLMNRNGATGEYYVYTDEYVYYDNGEEIQSGGLSEEQHISQLVEQMKRLQLVTPISGEPLMTYAQNNKDDITPLIVFEALRDISRMMSDYDEYSTQSLAVGTNIRYYIKDNENGQIITNSDWKSIAEAEKAAKDNGLFLGGKRGADGFSIAQDATGGFEGAKQRIKQQLLISESEEVVISVDKKYPISDQLSEFNHAYNNLKPYFSFLLSAAIASLVAMIVCFILAIITTGYSKEKDKVYLNRFDCIPTEIGAAIVCIFGFISLLIVVEVYEVFDIYGYSIVNILYVMAMLIVATLIGTWGLLSLVRRIKARDLWKNSVCCRGIKIIKNAYGAGKMSSRLVIVFGGFALAHVFMTAIWGILGVIILMIADAVILMRLLKEVQERQKVKEGLDIIAAGDLDYKLDTANLQQDNKNMAEAANKIADGLQSAVEKSMKNERMRSELITNVSHDIKTPLTSIINYVDLLKREDIQNLQVKGYIDILDAKSQRLKHLTEDLVEASKVSSGNIELHMDNLFVQELLQQAEGEFSEKLEARRLELVSTLTAEQIIIKADGRQMWRIFENLLNNIAKYALEGTRVYVDLIKEDKKAILMFKNMSQEALNINADELTERFVRGDISRTTEGSGLGLSIAKSLTELQGGKFDIYLDGDLFKVTLTFDTI